MNKFILELCFLLFVWTLQIDNVENTDYMYFGNMIKRIRRDVDTSKDSSEAKTCKNVLDDTALKKIRKHMYPLKDDRNYDLQLAWVGKDSETQLLLTTMQLSFFSGIFGHKSSSKLYQSDDNGRTFQNIQSKINDTAIRSNFGIMKSSLDPTRLILISYLSTNTFSLFSFMKRKNSFLVITMDSGKTFRTVELPFILRENVPLQFHPKKKDWILALEQEKTVVTFTSRKRYGQAWISKDFGKTWKPMMNGYIAATVKWGAADGKEGDEIYLSTHIHDDTSSIFASSTTLTLWRSSDGGSLFEEIARHCYNFGVQGNFVFASVDFEEKGAGKEEIKKRIMHVSKDSGATFQRVQVPEITPDMFYAVMEMDKGMMFLHVDNEGDTGYGTLYISDADGIMYTKSLDRHLYTNQGYTDFFNFVSMKGVYITQTLAADKTIKSVITYDRGVAWQPIYIDRKVYCKNKTAEEVCTLHFHNIFSATKMPFNVQGPLSTESAPGIMLLHGQASDALTGTTNIWLSRNGGYNWTRVAFGAHHYAIGDNGNLIVLVPRVNTTGTTLKYSIDQGRCWRELKFADDPLTIRGLVTEPHSNERMFSLWGYEKDAPVGSKEWNVVTINFHNMFSAQCYASDFEEWYPHTLNGKGGCFLGEKTTFRRPREDKICYLGKRYNPVVIVEKCKCTRDDLECDFGYERQKNNTCKRNIKLKLEVCKNGEEEIERFSKGYRRVPGDNCKTDDVADDVITYIDEHKKCKPSKTDIFGVVKEVEKEKLDEAKEADEQLEELRKAVAGKKKKKKSKTFLVVLAIILVFVLGGVGYWYGKKYIERERYKAQFSMSRLDEHHDNDDELFDPRPKGHRPFKDESDIEDDVLLPV